MDGDRQCGEDAHRAQCDPPSGHQLLPRTSAITLGLIPRADQRKASQAAPRLVSTAKIVFHRIHRSRVNDQFST